MKDQVMTMKTHTESSKSELSSGTLGRVKVYSFGSGFGSSVDALISVIVCMPFAANMAVDFIIIIPVPH